MPQLGSAVSQTARLPPVPDLGFFPVPRSITRPHLLPCLRWPPGADDLAFSPPFPSSSCTLHIVCRRALLLNSPKPPKFLLQSLLVSPPTFPCGPFLRGLIATTIPTIPTLRRRHRSRPATTATTITTTITTTTPHRLGPNSAADAPAPAPAPSRPGPIRVILASSSPTTIPFASSSPTSLNRSYWLASTADTKNITTKG